MPCKQGPGHSSFSDPQTSQQARGSPGRESAHVDLPCVTDPFQGCGSQPDAFSFGPIQLHENLFFSFGCVSGLLPVFNWFHERIVLHGGILLMYLWEEMGSMSFYSSILI